jgi:glycosyltransferase involved in cell wall biosynthesis
MKRSFRVAMVAACPLPAERGTPSRIIRMAEALRDLGHEIHIVTYHLGTPMKENGVAIHRIPNIPTYKRFSPGPTYQKVLVVDPILLMNLVHVVHKHRIDLIHAHHFEGALVAYAARLVTGRKVIYDAHTTLEGELHHYKTRVPSSASRFLDRMVPLSADHVIACSNDIKTFVMEKGRSERDITVIPTGVNLEDFEVEASDIRASIGVGEAPLVVYTGGLAAFQGVSYLLAAMKIVLQKRPDAKLLVVSADTDFTHLRDESTALGIVGSTTFMPGVPFTKVPPLLACADVAVIPRVGCPGVPQKLGNYMAAARPIVSFEGAAKLLKDGETGLIVTDGDVAALADAIVRILGDPALAKRLGEAGRDQIARDYSWPPLAKLVEEVYEKVASGGAQGHAAGDSPK